ncbi:hypothetical protein [Streptomyces sp. NPDC086010]|uniref:hypothetical protein n=1 Tax=Streptomyces sp. NPDC086010 TaxID=3365745 RepID=UPI0037D3118E
MVEWQSLLAGDSFEALVDAGEPRLVAGDDDDGCVVFAVSPRLYAALAETGRPELRDIAAAWSAWRAGDGDIIDAEIAEVILTDLADLVSSARRRGQGVYCWVA